MGIRKVMNNSNQPEKKVQDKLVEAMRLYEDRPKIDGRRKKVT